MRLRALDITVVHPGGVATGIADSARHAADATNEEIEQGLARARRMLTLPPERAGEIIVSGVERRAARVLVGNDAKFIALLERLAPVSYWNTLQKLLVRS